MFGRQLAGSVWQGSFQERFAISFGAFIVLGICAMFVQMPTRETTNAKRYLEDVGARMRCHQGSVVKHIAINDKRIVDATLENVAKFRSLESLSLSRSTLGSGQAKHLATISSLRTLALYDTNISSYELRYVRQCRHLEVLSLDGTPIGNAGVRSLVGLDELRYLSLARTEVDDSIVDFVSQMSGLSELDLRGTNVTADAISQLRQALPECHITADANNRTAKRGWIAFRGDRRRISARTL